MSLVAYDSSEESGEEFSQNSHNLATSSKNSISLDAKKRERVKIAIPSLKEFEEDHVEVPVKKTKLQPGSGLFSILPPPQNISSFNKPGFIPNVLSSKKAQTPAILKACEDHTIQIKQPLSSDMTEKQDMCCNVSLENEKSEENSHIISSNFFSLDNIGSNNSVSNIHRISDNIQTGNYAEVSKVEQSTEQLQSLPDHYFHHQMPLVGTYQTDCFQPENASEYFENSSGYFNEPAASSPDTKESLLKDQEFLKLQGRRQELETFDIIDVNADDQLTNKNEWLMKSLTEETTHRPSRKKHNLPTQQQKRKHQITYLAFQAKEREMDLKNQWSMNSRTRRETQAKYGF